MAKRGLRKIVPVKRMPVKQKNRHWTPDVRCAEILQRFRLLHVIHGDAAVIHAYAKERGINDGFGWFEVRGVTNGDGKPKRYYANWADPRRRTEHLAHIELLEWVDKGRKELAGFRLNQNGRDFLDGVATIKRDSYFKNRVLHKQTGPQMSVTDIKNVPADPHYWDTFRDKLKYDWEI